LMMLACVRVNENWVNDLSQLKWEKIDQNNNSNKVIHTYYLFSNPISIWTYGILTPRLASSRTHFREEFSAFTIQTHKEWDNLHIRLLPKSALNKKSVKRCILVEASLTTLKSPQSSGTKFQRNSASVLQYERGKFLAYTL
jgi:hypothetical protein